MNGPVVGAGKRQVASPLSGSSAQAFPPATKATVCARTSAPIGHPAGSTSPFANVVMIVEGGEEVDPEADGEGACDDDPVQAASATVSYSAANVFIADIAAGVTVGIGYTIATSGGSIGQAVIQGYLFP